MKRIASGQGEITFRRTRIGGIDGNDGDGVLDGFTALAIRLIVMSEGVRGSAEKRFQFDKVDFKGLLAIVGLGGGPPSVSTGGVLTDTFILTQLTSLRNSGAGWFVLDGCLEIDGTLTKRAGSSSVAGDEVAS